MDVYVSVTNTYCVCGKLEVPSDLEYYLARLLCWPQWPCQLFQWPHNAHQYNRGRDRRQQFPRGEKDSLPGPSDWCHPHFPFQSKRSEFCYWLIHSKMRETFKTNISDSVLYRNFSYLFPDLIATTILSSWSGKCHCAHFIDNEAGAQISQSILSGGMVKKWVPNLLHP